MSVTTEVAEMMEELMKTPAFAFGVRNAALTASVAVGNVNSLTEDILIQAREFEGYLLNG